jgi:thiamine transporter ThiT
MEWKHGLKSGAVAGVIYGVFAGIINVVYMTAMREEIIERIQAAMPQGMSIPISIDQLYTITLISAFPSGIVMAVIVGMVFGVIFMLLREELLGNTPKKRGIFLSIILFAFFGLAEMFSAENAVGAFFMLRFSPWYLIPASFGAFLLLGYLTGMFWERFGKK